MYTYWKCRYVNCTTRSDRLRRPELTLPLKHLPELPDTAFRQHLEATAALVDQRAAAVMDFEPPLAALVYALVARWKPVGSSVSLDDCIARAATLL